MFRNSIPLFRLFGFSVRMDWSWLILFVLITWSLAVGAFPYYYPSVDANTYLWMGVAGAIGLFLSIIFHELGHALMARRYGVEMRGITLFVFGGVAEMKSEPRSAMAEFMIAVAGPLVSVALGVLFLLGGFTGSAVGLPLAVGGVLMYLGWINLVVVGFNLVPAFPLDGGRMLRAFLWHYSENLLWATKITSTIGSAFGILLIALGVISLVGGNFIGGMWWFLLGLFLRGAAKMSYRQLLVRSALESETVDRLMQPHVETVPPTATVQEFVDNYVYKHHFKMFPVTENGTLRGCMTTRKVKDLPREEWSRHTVAELVEPCSAKNTVDVRADATTALNIMNENDTTRLLVVENGHLRGIVGLREMMKFISLKMELETED